MEAGYKHFTLNAPILFLQNHIYIIYNFKALKYFFDHDFYWFALINSQPVKNEN